MLWRLAIRRQARPVLAAAATTAAAAMLVASSATTSTLTEQGVHDKNENERQESHRWLAAAANAGQTTTWMTAMANVGAVVTRVTRCDDALPAPTSSALDDGGGAPALEEADPSKASKPRFDKAPPAPRVGFRPDAPGDYRGLFPARQLWRPSVEYPLWYVRFVGDVT